MELKDQVVSLELAKKLKELGVKQESLFDWIEWGDGKHKLVYNDMEHNYNASVKMSFFSAFTVAELGEMLPMLFSSSRSGIGWSVEEDALVEKVFNKYNDKITHADTEADARAKMLIYLLENRLFSL